MPRALAATLGFALVAWPVCALIWPDRLQFLYPAFALGPALFGAAFFLLGVLLKSYAMRSFTRILTGVFAVVLAYFVFAEPLHLAMAGAEIRALDGEAREGVTIQSTHFTCVPAALATVLRHWGIRATEGELAYALRTAFQGTHVARVPQVVREVGAPKGLRAQVVSMTLGELRSLTQPAILLGYSGSVRHAVAFLRLEGDEILVGDPLTGLKRLRLQQWEREFRWSGQAIRVFPI